jgi:hypothetical protein
MVSDEVVEEALALDATSKLIMRKGLAPAAGDIVGIRFNLNLIKRKGVPTVRRLGNGVPQGRYTGKRVLQCVAKRQGGRASGAVSKFPLASVDGAFMDTAPDLLGLKISFNPK